MIEFLKKIGASKKGAAAVLGLGGAASAVAILSDVVPHDSPEAQGAVAAVAVLLGLIGVVAGPKVAAKLGGLLAPKAPEAGK
jgi:MFS family permease